VLLALMSLPSTVILEVMMRVDLHAMSAEKVLVVTKLGAQLLKQSAQLVMVLATLRFPSLQTNPG